MLNRHIKENYILIALKGFCMGAADVVPGVSGGTMALILGIYERLLLAIRAFDLNFFRLLFTLRIREALSSVPVGFLISLLSGILLAIFTLARLIAWVLANHPVMIWSFFFGLILASITTVARHVVRWSWPLTAAALGGAIGAYVLVGLVPMTTPETYWFVFISGAIAICAMILPGISGSFILVLLGKYQYILNAVNNRNFTVLLVFSLGAGLGLAAFSRLLGWMLARWPDLTIAVLCGLMIGSLRKVWPWKDSGLNVLPAGLNTEVALSFLLALFGLALVLLLDRMVRGKHVQSK